MRELSRFFGIVVRLFDDDHSSPHFHASYGSAKIAWPNGADLDPLMLHSRVTGAPIVLDIPSRKVG